MEFMLDFACDTACGDLPVCPTIDVRRRSVNEITCLHQKQNWMVAVVVVVMDCDSPTGNGTGCTC